MKNKKSTVQITADHPKVASPKIVRKKRKSSKGALIKGMSRNLPMDILTDPIFEQRLEELLGSYGGIYTLYRGKTLYYVGLARRLRGRIRWHLKDRHADRWDSFKVFRIQKVRYLKDIETLIQNIANPKGNRAIGQVPKDADLNRALRDVLREYNKKMKIFKRALR